MFSLRSVPVTAVALLLGALVLSGCGISLTAGDEETEFFKDITLERREYLPGEPVKFTLDYAQLYTVPVDLKCDILAGSLDLVDTPVATPEPTPTLEQGQTPTSLPLPAPEKTPKYRIADLFLESVPPNPEGGPVGEATPVLGTLEGGFDAPSRPGKYVLRCYTPQDDNNGLARSFTVLPPQTPEP